MEINPQDFINGGELDYTARYECGNRIGRLSLKRKGEKYQLYVHCYGDGIEIVLFESRSLKAVVDHANNIMGYNDVAVECA